MTRRHRLGAVGVAVLLCAGVATGAPPVESDAAWSDAEQASGSVSTLRVASPGAVRCANQGLLQQAVVTWSPPPDDATILGYQWSLDGGARSPTLPSSTRSVTVSGGLLQLGTFEFRLYAIGPGGWEAEATNRPRVSIVSLAGLGVLASCA
ncbi:fibronectin type III domain-containing protein [Microbacterium radiodurans]|uniref:Fibronectin type III domain-containing protein n=1 Tax=Microbacterium radiodurans TaxID=661398 RepID=A0A5J5ISZ8_9MICO|nr:fibronectin type III domain-containing protein [Microbacterium radiodurans]KAA9089143.1 fibronectin type III domain-containing protein [Microbacterium radiodurans]